MPNWCENKIVIESKDLARLQVIQEELKGPIDANFYMKPSEVALQKRYDPNYNENFHEENVDLSFQKLVPIPQEVAQADNPERLNSSQVYDGPRFNHSNDAHTHYWNTKWPATHILSELREEPASNNEAPFYYLIYEFSTAWSPPVSIYKALAEKFPDVEVSCYAYEPAMDYALSYENLGDEYEIIDVSPDDIQGFAEAHFGYDEDFFSHDDDDDF